jgi:hypothetical protein
MKRVVVEKRTPLSYWAFLIPGLFIVLVSALSLIFNSTNNPAMKLFLYIGILFLIIGIIKFLVKNYNKGALAKSEEKFASRLSGMPQKNLISSSSLNEKFNKSPVVLTCSRCGAKNYSSSNFCHMCGKKL